MASTNNVYLDVGITKDSSVEVPLETYIAAYVLVYVETSGLDIWLVTTEVGHHFSLSTEVVRELKGQLISKENLPKQVQSCCRPAVQSADHLTYIGGLSAVLRWAIKTTLLNKPCHPYKDILGFRGGCLVACAENSIWTKFCEVDLPHATCHFAECVHTQRFNGSFILPKELIQLETHLQQPVRTHNILKRKQDLRKIIKQKNADTANKTKIVFSLDRSSDYTDNCRSSEDGINLLINNMKLAVDCDPANIELKHFYMEGIDLTLADIILLPCVHYLLVELAKKIALLKTHLPLLSSWHENMFTFHSVKRAAKLCGWTFLNTDNPETQDSCVDIVMPWVAQQSLYSRDPTRGKTKIKCRSPVPVINVLKGTIIYPIYNPHPCLPHTCLDWNTLPTVVHPARGDLPLSRVTRKCQQLESLVTAVMKIILPGQTIVDFCAGGGHSGLLLAHHLPDCTVIMVENKEASMDRARSRAKELNLKNVAFFQCNLDYYQGSFDVGVSLHACGVATDLVINKCLQQNAAFVCCPCCYGAIQETHLIKYPRSKKFEESGISYKDFQLLCHCADRTEANTPMYEQGKYCMGLIDMDRVYLAEEYSYDVKLCTLQPPSCSPKNHLLIGTPSTKKQG